MPATRLKDKKTYIIPCLLAVFLLLPSVSEAQVRGMYNERLAENVVYESKLKRDVDFLCDSICEGRAVGTRGGAQAGFYLASKFKKFKLLPLGKGYSQSFYTADSICVGHNIVGMIPGSKRKSADSYVIIGAHYDHIGVLNGRLYPGADSNASGVAALLSIMDMFSSMKTLGKVYSSSIIFVAFDGKELNMAGSEDLWRRIKGGLLTDPVSGKTISRDKIKLMVNIDQVGSSLAPLGSGREDYLIMLGGHSLKKPYQDWLSMCNRFYDADLELAETYYGSKNFTDIFYRLSDQRIFVDNKVPAVLFTSGITLNTNKTYDKAETLNYSVLRRRIILMYHWIEKML